MAILVHFLRTVLVVATIVGLTFLLAFWAPILLLPYAVLLLWFFFYYAKWSAYYAPIAKEFKKRNWTSEEGHEMESILEKAQMHTPILGGTSVIRQEIWRFSVYDRIRKRRTRRVMIGDDAIYFGQPGGYNWFYVDGRYYCKVSGLVAFDRETGEIKFNRPKKEMTFSDLTNKSHIIEMDVKDKVVLVDLKELAESIDD